MSPILALVLFVAFFVLMVIVSGKTRVPIGIVGVLFAFILTGWLGGGSPMNVVNYFPTHTILSLFFAGTYFCYVNQTGLMSGIVDRILHMFKKRTWFIPFAVYIASVIVTLVGGAEPAPLIISPIIFALVSSAGLNPLLGLCLGYFGSSWTGTVFWCSGGASFRALAGAEIGEAASLTFSLQTFTLLACFYTVIVIIFYIVFKGHKMDSAKVALTLQKTPDPFTKKQKFALYTLAFVMVFTIVPTLIQSLIYANPVTAWMASHLGLKQNCLIGIVLFHIFGMVDGQETADIYKNKIPWLSFVNIAGCCAIVNCTKDLGLVEFISGALTSAIPAWFIPACIVLFSACLSFVSNAFAIIPMFAPMAAALAAATGLHESTICACILAGCISTGLSPVSMGGSLWQIGASADMREWIFKKQWLAAVIVAVALVVVSCLGVWNVWDALFY